MRNKKLNQQLEPIFKIILPKIQSENIRYWIYGGVANAAMVGECYRNNPDVDLFCLQEDFEKVEKILQNLCNRNDWRICKTFLKSGRPKMEVLILKNKKKWIERLSVVPAYLINDRVELKFREGSGEYSFDILRQVERDLGGFIFYTISNGFTKKLFIEYLDIKGKYPSKRIEDARRLLTEEEFERYFPRQAYKTF